MGIPSSSMAFTSPGLMISPGCVVTTRCRPSSCSMTNLVPHRASESLIFCWTRRSSPLRINRGCSFCAMTNTMSPGTCPGASSAAPERVIFCPWRMPLSICTSMTFFSGLTFFPLQSVHLSLGLIVVPLPSHAGHCCCICWIIPGAICRVTSRTPWPSQSVQVVFAPFTLDPDPSQPGQMTLRESCIFTVLPLYMLSSVVPIWCTRSSPFLGPRGPRLPPPPKNALKMSWASCIPPPPCSTASSPPSS
mmetsp:Transcript_19128/g.48302  ORF Transcript_19128/g.48302 Transcript_19128/m.48302 type:complete len:248 (+) Transcript_19128:430-1173(+)